MPRVTHFEIGANDPEKTGKFYSDVFGWKITRWDGGPMPYWMVDTGSGEGIGGGIMKKMNPMQTTVNTITVDNLDGYIEKVKAAGGRVLQPKTPVPTVGWLSYVTDIDGNPFGLMQMDKNAK